MRLPLLMYPDIKGLEIIPKPVFALAEVARRARGSSRHYV